MLHPIKKRETPQKLELTLVMYVDRVKSYFEQIPLPQMRNLFYRLSPAGRQHHGRRFGFGYCHRPPALVLREICSHFCPTGAVTLFYNDQPKAILAEHRALGNFYPAITLDAQKCPEPCPPLPEGESHWCRQERRLVANTLSDCPKSCRLCLTACPRQVVKLTEDENQVIPYPELCLRCTQCLQVCRTQAIQIIPKFIGRLVIADDLCPENCTRCIDLCPVKLIVREGARVYLKSEVCSLAGYAEISVLKAPSVLSGRRSSHFLENFRMPGKRR